MSQCQTISEIQLHCVIHLWSVIVFIFGHKYSHLFSESFMDMLIVVLVICFLSFSQYLMWKVSWSLYQMWLPEIQYIYMHIISRRNHFYIQNICLFCCDCQILYWFCSKLQLFLFCLLLFMFHVTKQRNYVKYMYTCLIRWTTYSVVDGWWLLCHKCKNWKVSCYYYIKAAYKYVTLSFVDNIVHM